MLAAWNAGRGSGESSKGAVHFLDGFYGAFLVLADVLAEVVGEKVRRERLWTSAGATPARELVRSTR